MEFEPRDEVWARGLLSVYAAACGFVIWPAMGLGRIGALPDLIFGGVALVTLGLAVRGRWWRGDGAGVGTFGFAVMALVAALVVGGLARGFVVEALAAAYLGSVALVTRTLLSRLGPGRRATVGMEALAIGATVQCAVALIIWSSMAVLGADPLAGLTPELTYPLLGDRPRAQGLTVSPNMLAATSTPGWAMLAAGLLAGRRSRAQLAAFATVSAALFLTASKSLLVVVAVGATVLVAGAGRPEALQAKTLRVVRVLRGLAVAVLVASTHLTLHRVGTRPFDEADWSEMLPGPTRLLRVGAWDVSATSYLKLKVAGFRVGADHAVFGVGPGHFADAVIEQPGATRAADGWFGFDPHSSVTGTFAEGGLVTLALLVVVVATAVLALRRIRSEGVEPVAVAALTAACVGLALEAISTDLLHLRTAWLVVGVLAAAAAPAVGRSGAQALRRGDGGDPGGPDPATERGEVSQGGGRVPERPHG